MIESLLMQPELVAAWMEGYTEGVTWPDAWETHGKPGGPYTHGGSSGYLHRHPEKKDAYETYCKLTRDVNRAWREGWDYGHAVKHGKKPGIEKIKVPPDFPEELKAKW